MHVAVTVDGTGDNGGRVVFYQTLGGRQPLPVAEVSFLVTGEYHRDKERMLAAIGKLSEVWGTVQAIGLAVSGMVGADNKQLQVVAPDVMRSWLRRDWLRGLGDVFDCPVVVRSKAEALALAESLYGLGAQRAYERSDLILMAWELDGVEAGCVRSTPDRRRLTIPMQLDTIFNERVEWHGRFGGALNWQMQNGQWEAVLSGIAAGLEQILAIQPVQLVVFRDFVTAYPGILQDLESRLGESLSSSPKLRQSALEESDLSLGALSLLSLLE